MVARVPEGALADRPRLAPLHGAAEVLYSDQTWRPCTVVAWVRYRYGWAALVRWPSGREDWRHFDLRSLRSRHRQTA